GDQVKAHKRGAVEGNEDDQARREDVVGSTLGKARAPRKVLQERCKKQQVADRLKQPDHDPDRIAQRRAQIGPKEQPSIAEQLCHWRSPLSSRSHVPQPRVPCSASRSERPVRRRKTSSSVGRASVTVLTGSPAPSSRRSTTGSAASP